MSGTSTSTRRRSRRRRTALLAALLLALPVLLAWNYGSYQIRPRPRDAGPPPADLAAQPVSIPRGEGRVSGWFVPGEPARGAVLLVHGVRGSRHGMLGRGRFLNRAGYAVLMVDLQAHGETPGEAISFGHRESRDVAAAVAWLRERLPGRAVFAIGVSMGGAAIVLAEPPLTLEGVVLESVYSRIEEAIGNRLAARLGEPGRALVPLLTFQLGLRLGLSASDLQPVSRIARLRAPVLVAGGTADRRTRPDETRALYRNAGGPKALWLVDGAGHRDLHAFDPASYRARVLAFLESRR